MKANFFYTRRQILIGQQ